MKCKPCEALGFHCDTGEKLKIAIEALVDVLGRTAGDDCHNAARYALEQIAPEELDPVKWSS